MLKLSEVLKGERENQGLNLEEISKKLKIKTIFLKALENGNYLLLPEKAYIEGFIKNYSIFLKLDPVKNIALFRRECDKQQEKDVLPRNLYRKQNIILNNLKFTPPSFGLIFFIIFTFVFIIFSDREMIFNPSLSIFYPKTNQVVENSSLTVSGQTSSDNITIIVNGQQTLVSKNGYFFKVIYLLPGQKILQIKALNKFGKNTTLNIPIIFKH